MTGGHSGIAYQNRLVAVIDVMGFRELLKGPGVSAALQKFYEETFEFLEAKGQIYHQTASDEAFRKLFVSDSIVLSVLLSDDRRKNIKIAARFFSAISFLQYMLAVKSKVWTRGAVSAGSLYINEQANILVGSAFVQAFELEKIADYPRIIVDPRLCQIFGCTPHKFVEEINSVDGYSGKLISPNGVNRIAFGAFRHEAIQIDWFGHAFNRRERLDSFFDDLKQRASLDQKLFKKAGRLLEYLRESVCLNTKSGAASGPSGKRVAMIDERLSEFGYSTSEMT
ncbi:MAG: hypothetical protein IPJ84_15315 [Bdellovibrionales bacterium]|nr:hypothetical protein [Bdellovibrionales bacterium]